MNQDSIAGRWKEVMGRLKSRWGRLTDEDLVRVAGRSEELAGALQRRYGLVREQAERDSNAFFLALSPTTEAPADGC